MPMLEEDDDVIATTPPALAKPKRKPLILGGDFTTSRIRTPQSVGVVIGDGGSGKTTFVTRYCPGPIAFFNFDGRSSDAIEEARELRGGDIIQEIEVRFPEDVLFMAKDRAKEVARTVVSKVLRNLTIATDAARRGKIKTIAFDTGTELNDLFQIFARGDVETTRGDDRGASKFLISRQWLTIFQLVSGCGANFIVLGRPKQKWANNAPVLDDFGPYMPEVVADATDWIGHIKPVVTGAGRKKGADVSFEIKMRKAGPNILELGRTYRSEDWEPLGGPFAYISSQLYTKVSRKVWLP